MHSWLEKNLTGANNELIWRAGIPLKIKIFMWLLFKNVVLTRDNLKKRNCVGNPLCYFCNETETANHLFFDCGAAKST